MDYIVNCKKSKPSLPQMCIICYSNGAHYLFVVDLNCEIAVDEFEEKRAPIQLLNIRGSKIFVDGSTIYVFEATHTSVYRYELTRDDLYASGGLTLEMTTMDKAPPLQHYKRYPQAVKYGTEAILVFSTRIIISCWNDVEKNEYTDFEIYNPYDFTMCRSLPALKVRFRCDYRRVGYTMFIYELFDVQSGSWFRFPCNQVSFAWSFDVKGYSLIDSNTLVLNTSLGSAFKLNLNSDEGWQVYQDGWLMEHRNHFFVVDHKFCIDGDGVYDSKKGDLDTKLEVWKNNCIYPLKGEWTDEDEGDEGDEEDEVDELRRSFQANEVLPSILECLNKVDRRVVWPRCGNVYRAGAKKGILINDTCFGLVEACRKMVSIDESGGLTPLSFMLIDLINLDFSKFPQLDFTEPLRRQLVESSQKPEVLRPCRAHLDLSESRQHQEWAKPIKSFKFMMEYYNSSDFCISDVYLVEIGS